MISPVRRREAVEHVSLTLGISERRTCRAIQQPRSTQRYQPLISNDESPLTQEIIKLASKYGRYGYRRITALLQNEG
jgi:putative transposase